MPRPLCIRSIAIVVGCLALAACGSDSPTFGDFVPDVGGGGDGSGVDADGGILPDGGGSDGGGADGGGADGGADECVTSGDCAGGEVCRDGVCREFCSDEEPCEGDQGVCDPDSGLCVDCLETSDCPGGFRCEAMECVSIDDVCESGAARCDGSDVEVCEGGQWVVAENCGELSCVDVGDGPSCQEQVCTPGERRCDGNTLRACNEDGTLESAVACAELPSCAAADFGCACDVDACVERVCRPGSSRCDGDDVLTCVGNGLDEVVGETCSGDETCQAGECLSSACDFGDTRCAGDTLLTCDFFGWVEEDCTDSGSFCDASTSTCREWVCEPGERACSASRLAVLECDERGTTSSRTACESDEYCRAGTCLPQICDPGSTFCGDGDAFQCDAVGGAAELIDSCSDAETCVDGACVGAGECTSNTDCPVPAGSCSGDTLVQYSASFGRCLSGSCSFDAVTTRTDCGRFDQVCSPGPPARCVETGCTSNADCPGGYCDGGLCVECLTAGDCSSSEFCLDGTCTDCDCDPGEICTASGACVPGGGGADDCTSDAQCQALAEAEGYTGTNAACSGAGRCYIIGICGDGGLGGTENFDPFGAACPSGTTCTPVIDLGGGFGAFNACGPCDSDGDCREGEVCTEGLLGLTGPYCGAEGGGGFPFPFP